MKTLHFTRGPLGWNDWRCTTLRGVKLCGPNVITYFRIPRGCRDVTFVFTKHPHPEAYEIKTTRTSYGLVWLDDWCPTFMYNARRVLRKMVKTGNKYVRCEYRT